MDLINLAFRGNNVLDSQEVCLAMVLTKWSHLWVQKLKRNSNKPKLNLTKQNNPALVTSKIFRKHASLGLYEQKPNHNKTSVSLFFKAADRTIG